jgi:hypothetical protein
VAAPELGELRQYRALFATLTKALQLPDDEDVIDRSALGRAGARARWAR